MQTTKQNAEHSYSCRSSDLLLVRTCARVRHHEVLFYSKQVSDQTPTSAADTVVERLAVGCCDFDRGRRSAVLLRTFFSLRLGGGHSAHNHFRDGRVSDHKRLLPHCGGQSADGRRTGGSADRKDDASVGGSVELCARPRGPVGVAAHSGHRRRVPVCRPCGRKALRNRPRVEVHRCRNGAHLSALHLDCACAGEHTRTSAAGQRVPVFATQSRCFPFRAVPDAALRRAPTRQRPRPRPRALLLLCRLLLRTGGHHSAPSSHTRHSHLSAVPCRQPRLGRPRRLRRVLHGKVSGRFWTLRAAVGTCASLFLCRTSVVLESRPRIRTHRRQQGEIKCTADCGRLCFY